MERVHRPRGGNSHPGQGFKSGQSGNPGGRSPETPGFRLRMREWMTATGEAKLLEMAEKDPCLTTEDRIDRRFSLQMIAAYAHHRPVTPAAIAVSDMTPRINIIAAPGRLLDLKANR